MFPGLVLLTCGMRKVCGQQKTLENINKKHIVISCEQLKGICRCSFYILPEIVLHTRSMGKVRGEQNPWTCPWICMDIHGCVYGHPWVSMDIHGYPWIYPWTSMDIQGYPWISMDIHGYIRGYIHGYPWISMHIHGYA